MLAKQRQKPAAGAIIYFFRPTHRGCLCRADGIAFQKPPDGGQGLGSFNTTVEGVLFTRDERPFRRMNFSTEGPYCGKRRDSLVISRKMKGVFIPVEVKSLISKVSRRRFPIYHQGSPGKTQVAGIRPHEIEEMTTIYELHVSPSPPN